MITIHNFVGGARGLRVCWQCEEMGLAHRVETVTFPPSAAYRAKHPLGSVPFLEDGAVAIHESVAIMMYLAERYGPTSLLPAKDTADFATVLDLTVFSEATLGASLNTLMAARYGAPPEHKDKGSARQNDQKVNRALGYLEARLGARDFLVGDDLTLADIAVVTGLGMMKGALQKPIPDALAAYRDRLLERPAYQRAKASQSGA
jgi:glutathione S-transferase